jgi:hypothetical protein
MTSVVTGGWLSGATIPKHLVGGGDWIARVLYADVEELWLQ